MALEEFTPLPSGYVHECCSCLYMWVPLLIILPLQSLRGKREALVFTFQINLNSFHFFCLSQHGAGKQLACIFKHPCDALTVPDLVKPALNMYYSTETGPSCPCARALMFNCSQWNKHIWNAVSDRGVVLVAVRSGGYRGGWLTHRRAGSETKEDIKFQHLNFSGPHIIGCRAWMTSERWLPLISSLKELQWPSKQTISVSQTI